MLPSRFAPILLLVFGLSLGLSQGLRAQPDSLVQGPVQQSAQRQSTALYHARRAHLWRVGVWGSANALGGLALVWGMSRSRRATIWNFGAMSAGWGLVNMGIATAGLIAGDAPPSDPGALLAAERQFHDILLFNLGLNVAYSAVGATMLGASYQDITNPERWRGFGTSLILQGAGLLVLDGIAFFASRSRLADLIGAKSTLSVHASPPSFAVTIPF